MSADMVAVVSSDAAPYRQAQEALTKRLSTDGHSLRVLSLEQVTTNGIATLGTPAGVIAIGSPAAVWLHEHNLTMPMLFCLVSHPERCGLLKPPATTGVSTDVPLTDQFALIREALPDAKAVGLLYRKGDPDSMQDLAAVRQALPAPLTLDAIAIDMESTHAAAIDTLLSRNIDVVWTSPDSSIWNEATVRSLLLTALRRKIPVFGYSTPFVRAGALLGVGLDPAMQGTQAGEMVADLLSGKTTAVVAPRFDIALNLMVAQKLEVVLPKNLQDRSKQVFGGSR
jgi:putative ABC transport system substrate-binding protein